MTPEEHNQKLRQDLIDKVNKRKADENTENENGIKESLSRMNKRLAEIETKINANPSADIVDLKEEARKLERRIEQLQQV